MRALYILYMYFFCFCSIKHFTIHSGCLSEPMFCQEVRLSSTTMGAVTQVHCYISQFTPGAYQNLCFARKCVIYIYMYVHIYVCTPRRILRSSCAQQSVCATRATWGWLGLPTLGYRLLARAPVCKNKRDVLLRRGCKKHTAGTLPTYKLV